MGKKKSERPPTKVPKHLTNRFRTNKVVISSSKPGVSENKVFRSCELPPIPSPSDSVTSLLIKYNYLNDQVPPNSNRSPRKRRRSQRINGFLAFRTFYTTSILNTDHQRELSVLLGKIWNTEENQSVWSTFAEAYNLDSLKTKPQFFEWICNASKK